MSSPITFSGFNNIDFNVVLDAIMQQASQPLTALQTRQRDLQSQVTTFRTFSSQISSLQSAAGALGDEDSFNSFAGSTTDATALGVSVGGGAVAGHYDVVVNELARAQVTASASSSPDANSTVVASAGTLTIGGVDVTLTGDVTLQGLADAINDTDGIGVSASVIRTATDTYRLVLTSSQTGADYAFTITNALTGGLGITFTDTDGDGTSGDSAADNAVSASDASLLVNNIAVTGSSNTFADVIPGVTLTALRKDTATTIGVDVASDSTAIKTKAQKFVSAYNDLVKFTTDQRNASVAGTSGAIGRDPLVRQLRSSLRTELLGESAAGTTFTRLSEVGIEFTTAGTLQINDAVFNEAVATDPDAVRALFTGDDGVFGRVATQLKEYTQASGFIPSATDRLTQQASGLDSQILSMQQRLAVQREGLLREFIQADQIMSQLRNQSSSLGSFGASLGSL
ncbi:MAG: flagellar filament capping protein FliD [Vicinamibacterales bacterium]